MGLQRCGRKSGPAEDVKCRSATAAGPAFPVPRQRRRRAVASPGGKREHVRVRRSEGRILTTHTGSLPRPAALTRLYARRVRGEAVDEAAVAAAGREALARIVPLQLDAGLDVVNNGEQQREVLRPLSPPPPDRLRRRERARRMGRRGRLPRVQGRVPGAGRRQGGGEQHQLPARGDRARRLRGPVGDPGRMRGVPRRARAPRGPLRGGVPDRAFSRASSPPSSRTGTTTRRSATWRRSARRCARSTPAILDAGFVLQLDCPDLALERHGSYRDRPLADFLAFCERVVASINAAIDGPAAGADPAARLLGQLRGAARPGRAAGRTSCRSSAGPASAASCCPSPTRATRTSTAASPRRRWTRTRSSSPASSTR